MSRWDRIVAAVGVMAAGCAHATGIPMGRGAPPKPPGCPVRHETVLPHEAQQRYEQVGVLCYTYLGGWEAMPDDFLDDIRPEACRLGGDVVVRHGFCPGRSRSNQKAGVEFGVYVNRPASPAAPAASAREQPGQPGQPGQEAPPPAPPPVPPL